MAAACTAEAAEAAADGDQTRHCMTMRTQDAGHNCETMLTKKTDTDAHNNQEVTTKTKTHDLNNLSEDDFRKLLEEAATFNRPSNSESTLLQQLRREVAESDLCDEVPQNDPELNISPGVQNKKCRQSSHGNRNDCHCPNANLCKDWNGSLAAAEEENGNPSWHPPECEKECSKCECVHGSSVSHHDRKSKWGCEGFVGQTWVSAADATCGGGGGNESKMPLVSCPSKTKPGMSLNSVKQAQNGQVGDETKGPKGVMRSACNATDSSVTPNATSDPISSRDGPRHVNSDSPNAKATCDTLSELQCVDQNSNGLEPSLLKSKVDPSLPLTSLVEIEMVEIKDQKKKAEIVDESAVALKKVPKVYQNCNENDRLYHSSCTTAVDDVLDFPLKSITSSERKEASQSRKTGNTDGVGIGRSSHDQHYVIHAEQCKSGQMLFEPSVNQGIISGKPYESRVHGLDMNGNQIICTMPSISHTMFSEPFILSSMKNTAYENHASKLEVGTIRKTKKSKCNSDDVIYAEDISGHRGNEGIDSLLEFINSTDKKNKNGASVGNCNSLSSVNSSNVNSSAIVQDVLVKKDKGSGKEAKNKNQKARSNVKKKNSSGVVSEDSGVMEENFDDSNSQDDNDNLHSTLAMNSSDPDKGNNNNALASKDHLEQNGGSIPSSQSSPDSLLSNETMSSFVSDFYAVTDVGQVFEESEFQVVVNKHRKRRLTKKSESFRHVGNNVAKRNLNNGSRSEGIMLLSSLPISHRGQRNKKGESVRRKSTSSMPPSEHSSADNSDVDSVHSLPVGGSAPAQSFPHSHTTPSSTSLTPQTSYADIAKMSRSRAAGFCLNSSSLPIGLAKGSQSEMAPENFAQSQDVQEGESKPDLPRRSPKCQSDATQTDSTLSPSSEGSPPASSASTSSSQSSPPQSDPPPSASESSTKITRESITQTDPVLLVNSLGSDSEKKQQLLPVDDSGDPPKQGKAQKDSVDSSKASSKKPPPALSPPPPPGASTQKPPPQQVDAKLSSSSLCKYDERPPVILMENCLPPEDMCGVTFGFEVNEELLKMTSSSESSASACVAAAAKKDAAEVTPKSSSSSALPVSVTFSGDDLSCAAAARGASEKASEKVPSGDRSTVPVSKQCAKDFPPVKQKHTPPQKSASRKDSELVLPFNYSQIVNFIGLAWEDSVRDCRLGEHEGRQNRGRRAKYYSD